MQLIKDTVNRDLGRRTHTCRICGSSGSFASYLVREMADGTKDEFEYFVCENCRCLQINEIPDDLGSYYGSEYYSFQVPEAPDMRFETPVIGNSKILDVGCGAGALLLALAKEGHGNLYGCDPFLKQERRYGDRVYIKNCSIHDMDEDGTFDYICMQDSFEHMTDPLEALVSAKRLLKPGGLLVMTIPTYPNIAFEMFGPHWYQLDAPRHIFLHSQESVRYLSEQCGLQITRIRYDANRFQIVKSFFYQHGVPLYRQTPELIAEYFDEQTLDGIAEQTVLYNRRQYGDHMELFWQKKA